MPEDTQTASMNNKFPGKSMPELEADTKASFPSGLTGSLSPPSHARSEGGLPHAPRIIQLTAESKPFVPSHSRDSSTVSERTNGTNDVAPKSPLKIHAAPFVPRPKSKSPQPTSPKRTKPRSSPSDGKSPSKVPRYRKLWPPFQPRASFLMSKHFDAEVHANLVVSETRLLPDDPRYKSVPQSLCEGTYHSLQPLRDPSRGGSREPFLGTQSDMFKAEGADGKFYAVRRLKGCSSFVQTHTKPWLSMLPQPAVVPLRNVFVSGDFEDGQALCFVQDFYPNSKSLHERYIASQEGSRKKISEEILWSYFCQLASGLTTIHAVGLAARSLDLSKVILTSHRRVRMSCCGFFDIMNAPHGPVEQYQMEDIIRLGELILSLACGVVVTPQLLPHCLQHLSTRYSSDIYKALSLMVQGKVQSVFELVNLISHRFVVTMQQLANHCDDLEAKYIKLSQKERLFDLVSKLSFVVNRPEFQNDPQFIQNGEFWVLRLFFDYVFHQRRGTGTAFLDNGHILQTLNKFDAGLSEKITLASWDGTTLVVVGFEDLKRKLIAALEHIQTVQPAHFGPGIHQPTEGSGHHSAQGSWDQSAYSGSPGAYGDQYGH
eukprot:279008_1